MKFPIGYHALGVVEDIFDKVVNQLKNKPKRRTTEFTLVYFCVLYYLVMRLFYLFIAKPHLLLAFAMLPAMVIIRKRFDLPPPELLCSAYLWQFLDYMESGQMAIYENVKYLYDKFFKDAETRQKIAAMNFDDEEAMKAVDSIFDDAEYGLCAGICQEIPCFDPVAPTTSGCLCCCPPTYDQTIYSVDIEGRTPDDFFKDVMQTLQTGDIYLGAYPRPFAKQANYMLHSKWTHAGVIYRRSDCPEILKTPLKNSDVESVDPSRPLVAEVLNWDGEAPMGDQCPAFTLRDFESVVLGYCRQKTDLDDQFNDMKEMGKDPHTERNKCPPFMVAVRRLLNPDGTPFTRTKQFYENVEAAIADTIPRTYSFDHIALGVNFGQFMLEPCKAMHCPCAKMYEDVAVAGLKEEDKEAVFCGEFVANVYKKTGLLAESANANEFSPPCFDSSRHININGAKLTGEFLLMGIDKDAESEQKEWGGRYEVTKTKDDDPLYDGFLYDIKAKPSTGPVAAPEQQAMGYQPPKISA